MTPDEKCSEEREAELRCCGVRHQFLVERLKALEDSVDDRFLAEEKAMHQRWGQLATAMTKVENLATTRADQQNEWRQTVNDIMSQHVTRSEYTLAHQALIEKSDALGRRLDRSEGKGIGQGQLLVWIFLGIASLVSVTGIIIDLVMRH